MAHYDIFRDRLGIKYPALGHALWEPSPGELYPPVEVGDVGFIREGKFHRLFNALLDANHPSQTSGVPEYHEPLRPTLAKHIDIGTLSPTDFCSYGVTMTGGVDVFAREPLGDADVSFSCSRTCGAALSLPVKARRKDTVARGDFGKWITKNIDSWFAFAQRLGLGVEQMEDIVLVTGHHRTRSWTNIAFFENSRVTLGVQVTGGVGASVNWQVSREYIQGAMLSEGPSGSNLPEDQCIFVRGFRVVRAFKLFPRLKGAAGYTQDPGEHDSEPESEVVPIPSFPKYKDPLHIFLEYIAERAPDCDLVLVHDDDLDRFCRTGDGTSLETLQPDAVVSCLQRSEPEIAQVACVSLSSENDGPRTNTRCSMVALFSEELSSWGGEFSISQRPDRFPLDATTPVPVSPPIRPAVQTPPIPVATTQTATLQSAPSRAAPGIPVHSSLFSFVRRIRRSRSPISDDQSPAPITRDPAFHIDSHNDIAMSSIQTSLALLAEGSSFAAKHPYIVPVAGCLLRVLTMRDEVKQYKEECEIVMHKLARLAGVIINVCEKYNLSEDEFPTSLRDILAFLQKEMDRIERVLKQCSKKKGIRSFLLRKDLLTKIKQCDVELSNVLQAFQAELGLDIRFALIAQRREIATDSDPVEAHILERTPAQPKQRVTSITGDVFLFTFFFFFFFFSFFSFSFVSAISFDFKSSTFLVGVTLVIVWFINRSRPRPPTPTPINDTSPLPRYPPLSDSLPGPSSAKQK